MQDLFEPLFELQDKRLNKLGDPLKALDRTIDWESFRATLSKVHTKPRKNNAGAKPKDPVLMFKALVIQNLHGLSDDQLEYHIEDRRSFQRFLGVSKHERSPDAKTFWAFRQRLAELGLIEVLFNAFNTQLNAAGYQARQGQIIDASIVPTPIQRNTREENQDIKQGEAPKKWSNSKHRQKDMDARWGKKHGKQYYGYKNHINVDNKNKLIRSFKVTDASVHDSQVLDELLDDSNSNKNVWADSAYRSKDTEKSLKAQGYRSRIHRKANRNKPLSKREKQGNNTKSKIRCRVEHVFGAQTDMRAKAIRSIGMVRAKTQIGLMNLVYNMRRFCYLQGGSTP